MTEIRQHKSVSRRALMLGLVAAPAAFTVVGSSPAAAGEIYTSVFSSVAIRGTDPVAYFTKGRPVEGSGDYEMQWRGATWHFASAENKSLFEANPEKYAPQFGGYCSWAVSRGYTASTDPEAWRIVDGRLYLNYSKGVQRQWEQDIPGNIAAGNRNWPGIKTTL